MVSRGSPPALMRLGSSRAAARIRRYPQASACIPPGRACLIDATTAGVPGAPHTREVAGSSPAAPIDVLPAGAGVPDDLVSPRLIRRALSGKVLEVPVKR